MKLDVDTTDHRTGTPTRVSTALALVVALAVVGLLVWQVDLVLTPVVVGSVSALCLAAGLWFVSLEDNVFLARLAAGVLALPVALGLLVATLGAVLLLASSFFPIESETTLSLLLTLVTQVGVVAGCIVAVLGIVLGIRNVVSAESLATYFWVTVQTALVPAIVGSILFSGAVFANSAAGSIGATVVDRLVQWLFEPRQLRTHVATMLLLVSVAAAAVRAAVDALPVAELLADSGTGRVDQHSVETLLSALGWMAGLMGIATVVAFAMEVLIRPPDLQRLLGLGLYRFLAELSTAPGLRALLVFVVVVSAGTALAMAALRRMAADSVEGLIGTLSPFVAGIVLLLGSVTVARPIVNTLLIEIGSQLPRPLDRTFYSHARDVIDFFGAESLVVVTTALLVSLTAVLLLLFRGAVFAGYLSDEMAGYSLASAGLLVAAAFAGAVVSAAWVVFVALIGSLFVWDMGRFGTTLGREMGPGAPTREAELVHAGGTLAVGILGAGLAYGLQRLLTSGSVEASPTAVVALMAGLAGLVLLVVALRE